MATQKRWTPEEDNLVLSGKVPDGRTEQSAAQRRHRLAVGKSVSQKVAMSPLKKARLAKNLTQKELSEITGIPLSSIVSYETGKRNLSTAAYEVVQILAIQLGVNASELVK